ncbi:hypothetical protein FB451DRAFT_1394583 [Mycena latifolia]|nr:hypothetical protein FB451DRAFT_1394583 [Mycena latifolia]
MASTRRLPLLTSVTQTHAISVSPNRYQSNSSLRTFNDMVDIGEFPMNQRIEAIRSIQMFGRARVEGMRVVYRMEGGLDNEVLHERDSGLVHEVLEIRGTSSANNDYLAGAYGRRIEDGSVGSISFVVFEVDNGRVETRGYGSYVQLPGLRADLQHPGPYGQPPSPGTPFSTFGNLVAFAGAQDNALGLVGLSFLKVGLQNQVML